MENSLLTYALLCFTSFFTLVNPPGIMPVFLTMTQSLDEHERAQTAKRAAIFGFAIMICFTLLGQFIFKFFGISANGFRIVGGFVIFKIGYDMLQAKIPSVKLKDSEIKEYARDISITPLGVPIACGPGAIANGIILMDSAPTWMHKVILVSAIAAVFLLAYMFFRASTRLTQILGETGINVMMRLMGLILMVIAIECFVSGIKPLLIETIKMAVG